MNDLKFKKILITGANGYIGNKLCQKLHTEGTTYMPIYRNDNRKTKSFAGKHYLLCDLSEDFNLIKDMEGFDILVHCAGKAHIFNNQNSKLDAEFNMINTKATRELALQANKAGIKHFFFLSTIGVHGLETKSGSKFSIKDRPFPKNPYSHSKFLAELEIKKISDKSDLKHTIIRCPLVYGNNAPGNWNRLVKLLSLNLPLPLGSINNLRSMVSIDNLVDLIIHCMSTRISENKTFLVSDDSDISIKELARIICENLNKRGRIFSFSPIALEILGLLIGKKETVKKLTRNFQIDIEFTKKELNWLPPFSIEEGIKKALTK